MLSMGSGWPGSGSKLKALRPQRPEKSGAASVPAAPARVAGSTTAAVSIPTLRPACAFLIIGHPFSDFGRGRAQTQMAKILRPIHGKNERGSAPLGGPIIFSRGLSRTTVIIRRQHRGKKSPVPGQHQEFTMRFMIIVKATPDTEAGKKADDELFHEMAAYHEGLAK